MSNVERATEVLVPHGYDAPTAHREAYCLCGTPIGEWGKDMLTHQLQALADAGLLVPDDAEVTTEYGVRHYLCDEVDDSRHAFVGHGDVKVQRTVTTIRTEWQEVRDGR